jgi:hypothetical protein
MCADVLPMSSLIDLYLNKETLKNEYQKIKDSLKSYIQNY